MCRTQHHSQYSIASVERNGAAFMCLMPRTGLHGVMCRTLMTMVLPHASAGATFHVHINSGKFHGTMAPITPSGSCSVYLKTAQAS